MEHLPVYGCCKEVSSGTEEGVDGSLHRQKPLGLARGLEPAHPSFSLAGRLVRILGAVIGPALGAVLATGQHLSVSRSITPQFVGHQDAWSITLLLEEFAEELKSRTFIAPTLEQDVQDLPVLIYRPEQVMYPPLNLEEDFIYMPLRANIPLPLADRANITRAEFTAPITNGFIANRDATLGQHLFDVTVAQGESVIEPNSMANNLRRKAVALV